MRKNKISVWIDKGNLFNIQDKLTLLRLFFWVVLMVERLKKVCNLNLVIRDYDKINVPR